MNKFQQARFDAERKKLEGTREFKNEFVPGGIRKKNMDYKIFLKGYLESNKNNTAKIAAYTSLSPNHSNAFSQLGAVSSWHKAGMDIYSINTPEEIQVLKNKYPSFIRFIPSHKTTKHVFGKPCILINEMIDHFTDNKTGDILMLINSDITLDMKPEFIEKVKKISDAGVLIAHRNDYGESTKINKKYIFGFDVFFIHKKYTSIFPHSLYSMGQTWWDYWVPYIVIKNNIPVVILEDDFAFHKEHPMQYKADDWRKMTDYFKWENNISAGDYQKINDDTRNIIINNSIPYTLCPTKTVKSQ